MKRKWAAALLAAWICLTFSGCSLSALDAKNLMAPPKANADQQAIHKLLQGDRPEITFVYPQNGEYRSAVIMQDFTGDGVKDAVGFYSLENSGGVEVQFLTKSQGEWRTLASFRNTAILVDRVCLGDLTGSGVNDVLIGWGSAAGTTGRTAAVNAYHCDERGVVTEYTLGIYGEMAVTDLDGNGVSEVFTVDKFVPAEEEGDEPSPAKARVYAWRNGTMAEICSTDADNAVSSYSSATFGMLARDLPGVLLDGTKADGSLTTQIFYLDGIRLKNAPKGVNTEEYANPFSRPSSAAFLCRDINGDGLLEAPAVSLLPCLPEDTPPDSTCYLVEWNGFSPEEGFQVQTRALMNVSENYWFRLPFQLNGRITAFNYPGRRTVTYMQVIPSEGDDAPLLSTSLFSIRAFTRSAWEKKGTSSGFELLAAQNDTVYGIQVRVQDERLRKYINQIRSSFKLLSE